MTTPTYKSEVPFTCFKCGDGNTPLYCLNCAEELILEDKADTLQSQVTNLRAQVERLHADGVVMRGALEGFVGHYDQKDIEHLKTLHPGRAAGEVCVKDVLTGRQALSTNAGQDLLARYQEAVTLLSAFQTEINPDQLRVWLAGSGQLERIVVLLKRTDTLLARVKVGL